MFTEEQEKTYLIYYNEIKEAIFDTYKYFYYFNYLKTNKETYVNQSVIKLFPEDLRDLLKKNICLNIYKIVIDDGSDALSLNKMKNFTRLHIDNNLRIQNVQIPKHLKENIVNIRHNMITHNLNNQQSYSVSITQLKSILDKIAECFNALNVKDITKSDEYFTSSTLNRIEELCESSISSFNI